jgi:hypothetical protein
MNKELADFLAEKETIKSRKNLLEFIPEAESYVPSRLKIDLRAFQRSVIAVNNFEGPALSKGEARSFTINEVLADSLTSIETLLKIINRENSPGEISKRLQDVENKVSWIENHYPQVTHRCNALIPMPSISQSISSRIRMVEDKILLIEEHFPQVANTCFDYTRDKTIENKGRVSKPRQYIQAARVIQQVDREGEAGLEIIKRLEELQKKLKKK